MTIGQSTSFITLDITSRTASWVSISAIDTGTYLFNVSGTVDVYTNI
jgi:hypothetical protein